VEECMAGVEARRGTVREDMPWVELEPDEDFLQFIREFPQHTRPKIYELLAASSAEGKKIYIFRNRQEAEAYIRNLLTSV